MSRRSRVESDVHASSRPSGNCQSKCWYTTCAASKALENVAEPAPVKETLWRRYLKRWTGILHCIVVTDSQTMQIADTHLGFSWIGGKSFDIMIPCMVKTASSISEPLFLFNKRQLDGFSISWITNLSENVLVPCQIIVRCKSLEFLLWYDSHPKQSS